MINYVLKCFENKELEMQGTSKQLLVKFKKRRKKWRKRRFGS